MSPGPLALVGGAEFAEGCSFDAELLQAAAGDAADGDADDDRRVEVVVLPTGAAYEHPQRSVEAATAWFEGLGATVRGLDVLDRAGAHDPANVDAVRRARFVYLVGGSPMHLRSVLKESPVWDALVQAWNDGAVVAGSDAGAMVLCDPMVDPRGGAFTVGLALVENLAVITHHDHWSEDAAHRTRVLSSGDLVLVGIDDRTALIRHPDGTWRSAGAGEVAVFVGGQPAALADIKI